MKRYGTSTQKTSASSYLPLLEQKVFQGQPLHHLKGSLYQVGGMTVEIHASAPEHPVYFYGTCLDPRVHMCLFVCGREEVVVCLEPEFLRRLPLSKSRNGKRSLFNLIPEDSLNGQALLIYKKNGKEDAYPIDVTDWCLPLYEAAGF